MDPVTTYAVVSGGLSFASNLFGRSQQRKQEQAAAARQKAAEDREFANQAAQTAYNSEFQKLMIDAYNDQTVKEYDIKLDQYKTQLDINREAAYGAFAAEQHKLNEEFAQAAFNRNAMIKELSSVIGAQRASRSGRTTSKSAERADIINSLGEFGRANMLVNKSLLSKRFAAKQRIGAIAGKHYQSDLSAYSKIQIPPRMRTPATGGGPNLQSPVAALNVPGIGFGDILSIGAGAAATGYKAWGSAQNWGQNMANWNASN